MLQKITYKGFLIAGISLCFIAISCDEKTDFLVKARYIYINDSQHQIECISHSPFVLSPLEEYTIESVSDGNKNTTEDSYHPPFVSALLIYDDIKCDTLDALGKAGRGEGIIGIQNYQSRQLGKRYYEFTYRFTEEDFNKAESCE